MEAVMNRGAIAVDRDLLTSIMSPYKEHCKYLKKVYIESQPAPQGIGRDRRAPGLVTATGEFSIPESCYIDDTGHFNSVEFHICYNQLIYVLLAYCVEHKLLDALKDMNLEEYRRRQLPDILLVDFETSFKRPIMNPHFFHGRLTIMKTAVRARTIFIRSYCCFYDSSNGFSEGVMLLAIVDNSKH
jgi:hypothetical protein